MRAVDGRMVLLDRDDCEASSTGDRGVGGGMKKPVDGASPVDGLGFDSFDFTDPVGVYGADGRLYLSLAASECSESNSKENPDFCWLGSSRLGRADAIGDGTASSLLFLPSKGGVPGNIGSCHSKCGVDKPENTRDSRSDTLRPRGKLYFAWVYDEASPARNPGVDLEPSKELAFRRWLICIASGPLVGLFSERRLVKLDELIGREKFRAEFRVGEPIEPLEPVLPWDTA